jgi:hypothetical protein
MSLREDRKKVQRSLTYWVDNYPWEKVLPELIKLRQTLVAYIAILTPNAPEPDHAESPTPPTAISETSEVGEVSIDNALVDAEVA